MGVYTTTRCGNCGTAWESMSYGRHSICGPEVVKCDECHALNKTEFTQFRNMNIFQKIYMFIGQFISAAVYGCMAIGLGIAGLNGSLGTGWGQILALLPLGYGMLTLYGFYKIINGSSFKEMEEAIDKNGGFLWSSEQY